MYLKSILFAHSLILMLMLKMPLQIYFKNLSSSKINLVMYIVVPVISVCMLLVAVSTWQLFNASLN